MHKPVASEDIRWSLEGDGWVGVFANASTGDSQHDDFFVEVLLRAEDWQVEVSHIASGAFKREQVEAADVEHVKAKAAELLRVFKAERLADQAAAPNVPSTTP